MDENGINWSQIGIRIAEMRNAKGITQQQLAEMTELSVAYIGFIEQGIRHGKLSTYLNIVTVLGYTMNDLFLDRIPGELLPQLTYNQQTRCPGNPVSDRETLLRIILELTEIVRHFQEPDQ